MKIDSPELTLLLDLANDLRKKKDNDVLSDLPSSIPEEPSECLVANAFNYGCEVMPGREFTRFAKNITFKTHEDAKLYQSIVLERTGDLMEIDDNFNFIVELHDDLNEIASKFDHHEYVEYIDEDWMHNYNEDFDRF